MDSPLWQLDPGFYPNAARVSRPPLGESDGRRHPAESAHAAQPVLGECLRGHVDLDARIWFFGEGAGLSGGVNQRLSLPPDVPAANFWSLTLYDAEKGSGLASGRPFPSLGSRDKPAQNADGGTDIFLGPRVYSLCELGRLPHVRISTHSIRVAENDLKAYVAACRVGK